jgi:hypothetical protein
LHYLDACLGPILEFMQRIERSQLAAKGEITEGIVCKISGQNQLRGANFTRPSTAGSIVLAVCRSMYNVDEQPVGSEIENHDRIDLVYRTTRTAAVEKR